MDDEGSSPNGGVSRRTLLQFAGSTFALSALGSGTVSAQEAATLRERATEAAADDAGVEEGDLELAHESIATYELLDGRYYDATFFAPEAESIQRVRLDEDGRVVDRGAVRERAAQAHREEYGKRTRRLHERIQNADPDESIDVSIWTDALDRSDARRSVGHDRRPGEPAVRRALGEEVRRRIGGHTDRIARGLRSVPGAAVESRGSAVPEVRGSVTPEALDRVEAMDDVWLVFERTDAEDAPDLSEASQTHGTYAERNGDYQVDPASYGVGVLDASGVPAAADLNREAVYPGSSAEGFPGDSWSETDDHAHRVALTAASTHDDHPGTASGAGIYAAEEQANGGRNEDIVAWMADQGVPVVNNSWSQTSGNVDPPEVTDRDLRWGQMVVNDDVQIVHTAGNACDGDPLNVNVPARGFNTFTIGAVDDGDDPTNHRIDEWMDATTSGCSSFQSCHENPVSEHDGAHTKPELSAVGAPIETSRNDGTHYGTSYAAPAVSGLLTLLQKLADDYGRTGLDQPEVNKAVAMASGSNAGDVDFSRNGLGTIRAAHAEEIVQNGQYATGQATDGGVQWDSSSQPSFSVDAGDTVTVVLCWQVDPSQANWQSLANVRSDVSVGLRVGEGSFTAASSLVEDRAYQWVRFQSDVTTNSMTVYTPQLDWEAPSGDAKPLCAAWHVTSDTELPGAPSNLQTTGSTQTSVDLAWDEAFDQGGSGMAEYAVLVDDGSGAVEDHTVPHGTTATTVDGLSSGTSYSFTVAARDAAGNEAQSSTVQASTDAAGTVVNDYDGSPAWPGSNDLGYWNGGGSLDNGGGDGEVVGGALRLEYSGGGWMKEEVNESMSAHDSLELVVRGDAGGEEDEFSLAMGGVTDTLSNLTSDTIGQSFSTVSVDMGANGMDASAPDRVELNFWNGTSATGAIEIDEIRFV